MNEFKSKKIFLEDQTYGYLFSSWVFIQKLRQMGFILKADVKTFEKNNWLKKLGIIIDENPGLSDIKIIFSIEKKSTGADNILISHIDLSNDNIRTDNAEDEVDRVLAFFYKKDFNKKKLLITAGPTIEDIDPVRYISNRSTGKMGIALARAAFMRGANVHLVLGDSTTLVPGYLKISRVRSASDMLKCVLSNFKRSEYFFSVAAVADYTPEKKETDKIKKTINNLSLDLKRTTDVLADVAQQKKMNQKVIGFSVETKDMIENSLQKLRRKNLDMIVANNPTEKDAGFASDTNKVTILTETSKIEVPVMSKLESAHRILDNVLLLEEN